MPRDTGGCARPSSGRRSPRLDMPPPLPPLLRTPEPVRLGVWSLLRLLASIVRLRLRVPQRDIRKYRTGLTLSGAEVLSALSSGQYPTYNKYSAREYSTEAAGPLLAANEVWNGDTYYIQHGIDTLNVPVEGSPLCMYLMSQSMLMRILIYTLSHFCSVRSVSTWVNGHTVAITKTHFDSQHNLILVLSGSCSFSTKPYDALHVELNERSSTRTPLNSHGWSQHVAGAGEALLQPAKLWHFVRSTSHCVKVAIFFDV